MQSKVKKVIVHPKTNELMLETKDPDRKVFIRSKDAIQVWLKGGSRKAHCIFSSEPPTFFIQFKSSEKYIWSAKVAKDQDSEDMLMYDLKRISQH